MKKQRVLHRKELEIKHLLEEHNIQFKHDTRITDGCSGRRPDFHIRTKWGSIILEVDEHQHQWGYTQECETIRMKQIQNDLGEFFVVFIRYNPDSYVSPYKYRRTKRYEYLLKCLREFMIQTKPKYNLSVLYLFYDGFRPDQLDYHQIC